MSANIIAAAFAGQPIDTLTYLSARYPLNVNVRQLSHITSEREQTIRNRLSRGTYPIPSFRIGRKRLFRLIDVAAFIDRQCLADPSHPANKRRRRGRPTKLEQLARAGTSQ